MSKETGPKNAPDRGNRDRSILRAVSVALLLVGVGMYLKGILDPPENPPEFEPFLVRPLTLSPDFRSAPSLPAEFGALAGQNLVLVTLDTTRADHLGFYGHKEIQTPHLDRIAGEGIVFTRAVATAPSTLPSHGSILTGLYPLHHGARTNSHFVVGEEHQTLAEVLSQNGYQTAAFVSSRVLDARFGLAQGFDSYDDNTRAHSSQQRTFEERLGDETTDRAIAWLKARSGGPFFLWVHYFDPHVPYNAPEPFASQYDFPYEGEIAFVDQQFGRLLDAVESEKGAETLVVVTADHGESLGADGERAHAYLVNEATIQIPLVFYSNRGLQGGVHVETRASQVDLVPTILSLLGIRSPEGLDGVDLALPPDARHAVLAETLEGRIDFAWSRLSALYEGRWKLVEGTRTELFDISSDPLAENDLSSTMPDELARLQKKLADLHASSEDVLRPSDDDLDPDEINQLKALGYMVGSSTGERVLASGSGADPRDVILRRSQIAVIEMLLEPAEAIAELEALIDEDPAFIPTYYNLYYLYEKGGDSEKVNRTIGRLRAARRSLAAEQNSE